MSSTKGVYDYLKMAINSGTFREYLSTLALISPFFQIIAFMKTTSLKNTYEPFFYRNDFYANEMF
jgi:hypothetical protein